jgi:predicted aspartyl protease
LKTDGLHLEVVLRRPTNAPESPTARLHYATPALVDTGASQCCIDLSIAKKLDLVRSDQTELAGVGGVVDANVYQCVVEIPRLNFRGELELFAPLDHPVPSMMLIGRSFLQAYTIMYVGPERCFYFYHAGGNSNPPYEDDDFAS